MKVGMGWCKWTSDQTLATDMQDIETAYRGAHEMACAIAGKDIAGARVDQIGTAEVRPMTTSLFAAMFGGMNK